MKRKFWWALALFLTATTAYLPPVCAGEAAPKAGGFSFRLGAGTGYLVSDDQLRPNDGNKRVRDLDDNANRYDAVIPLVNFDLRYTFADSGRQLYFGTPMSDEGPPGLTLGGVLPLADGSQIDIGAFVVPFGKVWEDPYLIDADRDETEKDTYGAKIDYSGILGTEFEAGYSLKRIDIDDDEIGRRFDDLERTGWVHSLQLGYALPLGQGLKLVPSTEFTVGAIDGAANAYKGYRLKLGLRRFGPDGLFNLSASVGYQSYDEDHPLFDKARDDVTYAVFGLYNRTNLFGHRPLFGTLIAGYSHRRSNIDFLEADTLISGLMLGYRF
jgi:hypothetical protein